MGTEITLTPEQEAQVELMAKAVEEKLGLDEIKRKFTPGDAEGDALDIEGKRITAVKPAGEGEKFGSFGEQLKAVMDAELGRSMDNRLYTKATGLSEGIDSEGGFLVQPEFVEELLRRTYETGILVNRCHKIPVGPNANGIRVRTLDESSRATGSRWGGIRGYWASEGGTKTASQPSFGRIGMDLEKLIGLSYVTDELLMDYVALENLVSEGFIEEFGFLLDDAIVNGTGSGQPLGILNANCTVSQAKETGQDATTIVTENIVKMWSRMWGRSRRNAIWCINQDIEPQLFTMSLAVGTGGIPVYMPANGLSVSPYGTLLGRPVLPVEQCATLGTVGDIILADFSQYLLIDKAGIQSATSIHVQFVTDETAFRFVYRVNGQPKWANALTPFKGSNTQSPFITLATRS